MKWVTVKKMSELTGYTEKAIYNKIERRIWAQEIMWKRAPDGRLMIDLEAFDHWVRGIAA